MESRQSIAGGETIAGDRLARLHDRVVHHLVAGRLGRDLEALEDAPELTRCPASG